MEPMKKTKSPHNCIYVRIKIIYNNNIIYLLYLRAPYAVVDANVIVSEPFPKPRISTGIIITTEPFVV